MKIYKSEKLIEHGKHIHVFFKQKETRKMPLHTHDFIEIVYILSGNVTQYINGSPYEMKRGDLLFLNYGSTHAFDACDGFDYINVCFSPEVLGDSIITSQNAFSILSLTAFNELRGDNNAGTISFSGKERHRIEAILFSMLRECQEKSVGWHTVTEHYLGILLSYMLRHTELVLPESDDNRIWQDLSEFIEANLDSPLKLSVLAGKCFYNPSYFSRVFKERFGVSPIEYITERRLDAAIRLLTETDLSIDEISRRVGFSDRRNFYHAFSKHIGCTPSEYRSDSPKK